MVLNLRDQTTSGGWEDENDHEVSITNVELDEQESSARYITANDLSLVVISQLLLFCAFTNLLASFGHLVRSSDIV